MAFMHYKISVFGTYDLDIKKFVVPTILIGQIGKNFSHDYNKLITGSELLEIACAKVQAIQKVSSGKLTYLECEDVPALLEFYRNNGFFAFGKRYLDREEQDTLSGKWVNLPGQSRVA